MMSMWNNRSASRIIKKKLDQLNKKYDDRLGQFTDFIFKLFFFGLALTKTGKPSLCNCSLSSPKTES
jgi:hypothetical protein